ncbi:MAG: toll/interleukin-1 receptor domain-containing protein [Planctomycetota bacterium]|nr:toll/interleukin-1 receptor domain-containing protein [Planctomycetota bacterium]
MADRTRELVFISYSHKDEAWLEKLLTMMAPLLLHATTTKVWHDRKIKPGQDWREEIEAALGNAKVAVLLVSPDFLASDFVTEVELPYLLQAEETRGVKLLWILVRNSIWEATPLARIQAAHDVCTPLTRLGNREDDVLKEICEKIGQAASTEDSAKVGLGSLLRDQNLGVAERIFQWVKHQERVHLKVCCYTLQTSLTELITLFGLLENLTDMSEIGLSILRPDMSKPFHIWNSRKKSDKAYWTAARTNADEVSVAAFRDIFPNYPIEVEERQFPFDPCLKMILVDDCRAWFGLYIVGDHTKKLPDADVTAVDFLGAKTPLIAFDEGVSESTVDELVRWFDHTWQLARRTRSSSR